jgi:hypothetical protein
VIYLADKKTLRKLLLHSSIVLIGLIALYFYAFATIFKSVPWNHSGYYMGKQYAYKLFYIYATVVLLPILLAYLVYFISNIRDVISMKTDQNCVRIFSIQSQRLLFVKKRYYLLYTKKFNNSNCFLVWLNWFKAIFVKAIYICSEDEIDFKTFNKMVELERYEKLDDIRYQLTFHKHSRVITKISRL